MEEDFRDVLNYRSLVLLRRARTRNDSAVKSSFTGRATKRPSFNNLLAAEILRVRGINVTVSSLYHRAMAVF